MIVKSIDKLAGMRTGTRLQPFCALSSQGTMGRHVINSSSWLFSASCIAS